MTSRISREWLIAAAGFGAAFLGLTLWVRFGGPLPFDARLLRAARSTVADPNLAVTPLYAFFGGAGSPLVAALTVTAAFAVVLCNVGLGAALLVPAAAVVSVAEYPLSRWVGRTDAARELLFPAGGYPSGHALYTLPMFGMLAWLGRRHGRPEVAAVCLLVVVLMAVSRVADRSHLADEVLGGYLLGAAWLCLVIAVAGRADQGLRAKHR